MLVEREQFLAAMTELFAELSAGHGRLVFLGGEAGVGKTALLRAFVASVGDANTVRFGSCDNLTTAAPLGPVIEAVPELAEVVAGDPAVDRLGLFRELRRVLGAAPSVLVLEDVHWADEATLDTLRVVGRRLVNLPTLVLATFRDDEVGRSHPLTVVLGDLATTSGVVRMQLLPLTVAGVGELVRAAGSQLDPAELHGRTAGNPFYVTEVLAAADRLLPATVRDAVLARTQRLSADGQRVLQATAVLGSRVEVPLLKLVAGPSADAIDECVLHGVLEGEPTTVSFRHELARLAVEQTLSPTERADLHAAALAALRSTGRGDDRQLAYHAAGCTDAEAVLDHAPRAAVTAAALGAHRQAAELYRLAIDFATPATGNPVGLWAALSYECYLTEQLEEAHAARLEAMRLADEAGDLLEVGASQRWLSRLSWFLARNEESERWATQAIVTLGQLGDTRELAWAYSNLAQLRMLAGDVDAALAGGRRAIELSRALGDREIEIHALNNVGTTLMSCSDDVAGLHQLKQSLDMALADNAHEHVARAYTNLGTGAAANRRFDVADSNLRAGIAYCLDHDLDSWRLYMMSWLGWSLAEQGHYEAARRAVRDVLKHPSVSPVTRVTAEVVAGLLAVRTGDDGSAHLAESLDLALMTGESQRLVPAAAAVAEAAWLAGDHSAIVDAVDHAWPAAVAYPNPWQLGALSWWLAAAGVERAAPIALAEPFRLMQQREWLAANDEWTRIGCPLWAALALAQAPGVDHARAALEIVAGLGATRVHEAILRDRHAQGLALPRKRRTTAPSNQWGLTAREIEILELLAEGLSYAELAGRLFLSEKTIGNHVSSILRKTGEPSRSRAVASALRHGVVTSS